LTKYLITLTEAIQIFCKILSFNILTLHLTNLTLHLTKRKGEWYWHFLYSKLVGPSTGNSLRATVPLIPPCLQSCGGLVTACLLLLARQAPLGIVGQCISVTLCLQRRCFDLAPVISFPSGLFMRNFARQMHCVATRRFAFEKKLVQLNAVDYVHM